MLPERQMKTLQLDITFTRDYHARHFGLKYGPDYFDDVRTRAETDMASRRALFQRFGDLGLGQQDPQPVVQLGYDDTLNVTLMFGGQLQVSSGISWVHPGFLAANNVETLQPPPIPDTWPHSKFLQQFETAVKAFGPDSVRPPVPHGILEAALEMRGQEFLEDMLVQPALANHLLDVLTEIVINLKEFWDRKCFGRPVRGLSLGGCSTTMLSPDQVAAFLVPRYSRIARRFGDAFVCSCGPSTHNLQNLSAIEGVRYVRLGWGTDLNKAAHFMKHRHIKASLDVVRCATLDPDRIAQDVENVLSSLEPVDEVSLLLIHAGADTPDDNVRRIVQTALSFSDHNEVQTRSTFSWDAERATGRHHKM